MMCSFPYRQPDGHVAYEALSFAHAPANVVPRRRVFDLSANQARGAQSSALDATRNSKYEFYGKSNYFLWLRFSVLVGYFTNWQMHSHMFGFFKAM
jgi:hypothetical protein